MKKDKELIEVIVNQLKEAKDFPYREGAWESFSKRQGGQVSLVKPIYKYLSAAAVLLLGLSISYYVHKNNDAVDSDVRQMIVEKIDKENHEGQALQQIQRPIENTVLSNSSKENKVDTHEESNLFNTLLTSVSIDKQSIDLALALPAIQISGPEYIDMNGFIDMASISKSKSSSDLKEHLLLANAAVTKNMLSNSNLEQGLSPKRFNFSDRFDLGLFVSPYTSTESLRVGAGLTFAYNISDKLSIRTGASFNSYEVGMLKNPFDASSVEQVETTVSNSSLQSAGQNGLFYEVSRFALPNINAVKGFVQSIEVPLELKYNLNKSLYAVGGISYSTIVKQERNVQYMEHVNNNTYDSGFLEDDKKVSKSVTRTVKSVENNVNPSGYSGFINISVGKKVNVNRKFGLSIEPYYKIPVGEFRKADMNYSNGGVRIMTNF